MNDKDKEAFGKWFKDAWGIDFDSYDFRHTIQAKAWQAACKHKQKEIEELKIKLNVCKNDYWFMINLIERYSTDKEQTLNDCLERMKFRKGLFNILEER